MASGQSKETALVIFLAFLAKLTILYYIILTAFKKYWPDTEAKFISGTHETFTVFPHIVAAATILFWKFE